MPILWLFLIVSGIAIAGYYLGKARVMQSAGGDRRHMHSLPSYYGGNVAIKAAVPALLLMLVWLLVQPMIVNNSVSALIPDSAIDENSSRGLVLSEVRRAADGLNRAVAQGTMHADLANDPQADPDEVTSRLQDAGAIVTSQITRPILNAAQSYRQQTQRGNLLMSAAVIVLALLGALWGLRGAQADFRARNVVETAKRKKKKRKK